MHRLTPLPLLLTLLAAPLALHTFPFDPETTGVVGELQVTYARYEDTIPDIARRFTPLRWAGFLRRDYARKVAASIPHRQARGRVAS